MARRVPRGRFRCRAWKEGITAAGEVPQPVCVTEPALPRNLSAESIFRPTLSETALELEVGIR